METFSERLKWLRKARGFKQVELAEAAGMSRAQITGYETKSYRPSYGALCKLASALACSLDFLMNGKESPFPPIEETLGEQPGQPEPAEARSKRPGPEPKRPTAEVVRLLRPEPQAGAERRRRSGGRSATKDQRSPRPRGSRGG